MGKHSFLSKPRHVTPQIDHLGKMSPVLRVSTHIYGVSKEIDGKMFTSRVNLGMWPLKLIVSEKWALFWGFHFQLSSFCNWLSSWVCPVYNIPSWSVKSTSSVLWSSGNFCNISQNINSEAPVALATLKDKKSGIDMERWLTPWRTSTYERPFTQEGNYLVCTCAVAP